MNLTPAQFLKKSPNGYSRSRRLICATLCLFLLTAPAMADSISVNQVVQTLSGSQNTIDLRLNTLITQDPAPAKGGTQQSGSRAEGTQAQGGTKNESIISGVAITSEGQQLGVEYIAEGEVDGTICDCGEIPVLGGAFPKWPFLFLAAVPLAFINHCDDCDRQESSTPTPTPPSQSTPTPTPGVPEPGSLFLLGTGLAAAGAGLRRRFAKSKKEEE